MIEMEIWLDLGGRAFLLNPCGCTECPGGTTDVVEIKDFSTLSEAMWTEYIKGTEKTDGREIVIFPKHI